MSMKFVSKILLFLSIVILICEILLRILGYTPLVDNRAVAKIISTPSPMFCENESYGYAYCPGEFKVVLNESLEYKLSTNEFGFRSNATNSEYANASLAIFGCSFFSGMGIDDQDVLDVVLGTLVDSMQISNYAIPGHGMTTQLAQLKDLIDSKNPPSIAVFEIASFHLVRNPGAYTFLKNFASIKDKPVKYLTANLKEGDELIFEVIEVESKVSFLEQKSSLAFLVKKFLKRNEYSESYLLNLENALIKEAYSYCKENEIRAVFMVITKDDLSQKIMDEMDLEAIPYVLSQVDYNKDSFNLNPYDQHPNALAHRIYAEEIYEFITNAKAP